MPNTIYTTAEKLALSEFQPIPNFNSNGFTFYNRKSGVVIENAISTDKFGNVIFKDKFTETYLKDLVLRGKFIFEQRTENSNNYTLYFTDKFNRAYTLGELYYNLFEDVPKNMLYWFGDRAAKALSYGLDEHILNDHIVVDYSVQNLQTIAQYHNKDTWKNHWHTVPCLEVVTPEYIDGKYASISATLIYKVKSKYAAQTAFRIIDATTGLELTRVIHVPSKELDEAVTYTIPLNYQGPLPDSRIPGKTFTGLTYDDVSNLEYSKGVEVGKNISNNLDNYEAVSPLKHIIRIQWITCELDVNLDITGRIEGDFGRFLVDEHESSLNVVVYDTGMQLDDVGQMNGIINTSTIGQNTTLYKHQFDSVSIESMDNYSISFTPNKNVKIKLLEKTAYGFTIEWDVYVKNLLIDWCVVFKVNKQNTIDMTKLTNPKRMLNHYLFPGTDALDFCNEIAEKIIPNVGRGTPENPTDVELKLETIINEYKLKITDVNYVPKCCVNDDLNPKVIFTAVNGSSELPDCDTMGSGSHIIKELSLDGKPPKYIYDGNFQYDVTLENGESDNMKAGFIFPFMDSDGPGPTIMAFSGDCGKTVYNAANDGWGVLAYDYAVSLSGSAISGISGCEAVLGCSCCVSNNLLLVSNGNYDGVHFFTENNSVYITISGGNFGIGYDGNPKPTFSAYFYDGIKDKPFEFGGFFNDTYTVLKYKFPETTIPEHLKLVGSGNYLINFSTIDPVLRDQGGTGNNPIGPIFDSIRIKDNQPFYLVKFPKPDKCDQIPITSESYITITETIVNIIYEEDKKVKQDTEQFGTGYNFTDLFIDVKQDGSKRKLLELNDSLDRIRKIDLERLDADMRQKPNDLPVQELTDHLILTMTPITSGLGVLFESGTRVLKEYDFANFMTTLVIDDHFLGRPQFKHNFVIFDPNPAIIRGRNERPLFPDYKPVYSLKTKEDLLEYVYTVNYPYNNIPAFPNFIVGNYVINGELYNPLYDYRNYRLYGSYDLINKDVPYDIFNSAPLTVLDSRFIEGRMFRMNDKFFLIARDNLNSGIKYVSTFNQKDQVVKPVQTKFQEIPEIVYNANPSIRFIYKYTHG